MPKDNCLSKLYTIVKDKTKFKLVIRDKRKNFRQPLIRRTEHVREMIKQNFKPHIDKKTYNSWLQVVTRWVNCMERVKLIK